MDDLAALFEAYAEPDDRLPMARPADRRIPGHTPRLPRTEALKAELRELAASAPGDDPNESRLPWPDDWFDTSSPYQWKRCRDLWAAVLISCLKSMLVGSGKAGHLGAPGVISDGWIDTRDFVLVCTLAGAEASAVRRVVRAALPNQAARERLARALTFAVH